VEVFDNLWRILEISGRVPLGVFVMTDPFHTVLELSVMNPDGHDLLHFPFSFTVNLNWWRRVQMLTSQWFSSAGSS
jgi:hypothetical protein